MERKIQEYQRKFPQVKNLKITKSQREGKRYTAHFTLSEWPDTTDSRPRIVHFGSSVARTYLDGEPKKKRDAYRARASKITNMQGQYTYIIPGTANSFAYHLLW